MSDATPRPSTGPRSVPRYSRRTFLAGAGTAAAALTVGRPVVPVWAEPVTGPATRPSAPESLVKVLYDTLTDAQRKVICFPWDHRDPKKGLLRTRIENNWRITKPNLQDPFYTPDQRAIVRSIFEGMLDPDWVKRIDRQLKDDIGGYGKNQAVALFGTPAAEAGKPGKFEFVITSRHLTLRCDGNSAEHVAFGGPIMHGHAPTKDGIHKAKDHPGNIFWPQAQAANKLFTMLDGKQRDLALVKDGMPDEEQVEFRGKAPKKAFRGIPVTEMSADQREELQRVVRMLIEPYRQADRDEAVACLKAQGGLDACSLAFYAESDMGDDGVWDNWRLEGPSFVWHFRGKPHVHIWINVADDPGVELNAYQDSIM